MTGIGVADQLRKATRPFRALVYEALHHRYFIPICLTAAFVVRLGWIYRVDAQPVSDFRWYYERGIDFAAGRGYSVGPTAFWPENLPPAALIPDDEYPIDGRPTAYWPVGYPAFLGLLFTVFGPSLFAARAANVVLYMGILILSYFLAKRLFKSELTGRITVLVLAFYPNHIAYSSLISSEILFLFLLLSGIALLLVAKHRLWLVLASGFVFGLACLVKPQVLFVPAVVFAASLIGSLRRKVLSKHFFSFLIVYTALGVTILPWIIRNYKVFNDFVFISNNGGINLLVGNNPHAGGGYCCQEYIASTLSDVQGEHERDVKARVIALKYMAEHPGDTIKLIPKKLWHLYRADREAISRNEQGLSQTEGNKRVFFLFKGIAQLYYMLLLAASLLSIVFLFNQRRNKTRTQPLPTIGLWLVLYFTCVYLLTFGYSRFHFPIMVWFAMYVGALATVLIRPET